MDSQIATVIMGASGRMGQMLIAAVDAHPQMRLSAAVDRPGHAWIGQDLGEVLGGATRGLTVTDDPLEAIAPAQAIIDFTAPAATIATAELAAQAGAVHVIGTTGMTDADLAKIDAAAHHTAIVRAGNMSLGVNLLVALTRKVSAVLGTEFDIEVVEAHHRHKVDAPSGTALMLGEGRIGFSAIRGGDIVGEHDVIFAGAGERIVLTHKASDRMLFANGALRAALWGQDQEPGHYSMADVLGL